MKERKLYFLSLKKISVLVLWMVLVPRLGFSILPMDEVLTDPDQQLPPSILEQEMWGTMGTEIRGESAGQAPALSPQQNKARLMIEEFIRKNFEGFLRIEACQPPTFDCREEDLSRVGLYRQDTISNFSKWNFSHFNSRRGIGVVEFVLNGITSFGEMNTTGNQFSVVREYFYFSWKYSCSISLRARPFPLGFFFKERVVDRCRVLEPAP
jgi:hypothetical protein